MKLVDSIMLLPIFSYSNGMLYAYAETERMQNISLGFAVFFCNPFPTRFHDLVNGAFQMRKFIRLFNWYKHAFMGHFTVMDEEYVMPKCSLLRRLWISTKMVPLVWRNS